MMQQSAHYQNLDHGKKIMFLTDAKYYLRILIL